MWLEGEHRGITPALAFFVPYNFHWSKDFSSRRPSMRWWLARLSFTPRNSYVLLHVFVAAIRVAALPYLQVPGLPFIDTLFRFSTAVYDKSRGLLTQGRAKHKTSEALALFARSLNSTAPVA